MLIDFWQIRMEKASEPDSEELVALVDYYEMRYKDVMPATTRCVVKYMLLTNGLWLFIWLWHVLQSMQENT